MLGWIICHSEGRMRRLRPEVRTVCGLPLLTLETALPSSRWGRYRLLRALEGMAARGVRRAVVQGGVPGEILTRAGLEPVDCATLRRCLLPQLLDWTENAWGLELKNGTVGLSAARTDGAVRQAALLLARRARYLILDTGVGQEALEEELRRRCGLGCAAGKAALWVQLGGAVRGVPALYLGREDLHRQRLCLTAARLPEGEEMLFSALFQAGKLTIEEITIKSVEFCA